MSEFRYKQESVVIFTLIEPKWILPTLKKQCVSNDGMVSMTTTKKGETQRIGISALSMEGNTSHYATINLLGRWIQHALSFLTAAMAMFLPNTMALSPYLTSNLPCNLSLLQVGKNESISAFGCSGLLYVTVLIAKVQTGIWVIHQAVLCLVV